MAWGGTSHCNQVCFPVNPVSGIFAPFFRKLGAFFRNIAASFMSIGALLRKVSVCAPTAQQMTRAGSSRSYAAFFHFCGIRTS